MNTLLLLLVLVKGICLFFCWKSIKASRSFIQKSEYLVQADVVELEKKVRSSVELNHNLTHELQRIKREKSS